MVETFGEVSLDIMEDMVVIWGGCTISGSRRQMGRFAVILKERDLAIDWLKEWEPNDQSSDMVTLGL